MDILLLDVVYLKYIIHMDLQLQSIMQCVHIGHVGPTVLHGLVMQTVHIGQIVQVGLVMQNIQETPVVQTGHIMQNVQVGQVMQIVQIGQMNQNRHVFYYATADVEVQPLSVIVI